MKNKLAKILLFILLIVVFTVAFSFIFSGMMTAYKDNMMGLFICENILFTLVLTLFFIQIIEIYKL